MTLLPINQEYVLAFAMRYALGRHTAAPGIVVTEIEANWPRLRAWTKRDMKRDITQAVERQEIRDEDLPTWQKVLVLPMGDNIL